MTKSEHSVCHDMEKLSRVSSARARCSAEEPFHSPSVKSHLSVFREGSNKIPAILWEDYWGSFVKDGLGETRGREISWALLQ